MKLKLTTGIFIIIFAILLGCGKDSGITNDDNVYIRCRIDGVSRNFNFFANGNDKPSSDKVQAVVVGGWEGNDVLKFPALVIHLTKLDGIIPGPYSSANKAIYDISGEYYYQVKESGDNYRTVTYAADGNNDSNFQLTITSLNNWGIKGTFSGKFKKENENEWLTITDGEFSVPYN